MAYQEPSRSDVHVDRPLTGVSLAFMQDAESFVAPRAFPMIPVGSKSDEYFTYDRSYWFRDEMAKRAPGTESAGMTYGMATDSYSCAVWALHKDIADQVRENADPAVNLDREAAEILAHKALIRMERDWASQFFTTSVWTLDQTGVDSATPGANQFGRFDRADSEPIETVRAGRRIVQQRTGKKPNVIVMGPEVYDALLDHPDIVGRLDRGQTAGPAIVMKDALAALFEVDEILVMEGIYTTSDEGAATDTYAFIGGKSMLMLYRPPAPGLLTAAAGYGFSWSGMGGMMGGQRIKRMRDEMRESDRLEIQAAWDFKLVAADLGLFFNTAVN